MRNRPLFIIAGVGIAAGLVAAFIYAREKPAEAPLFNPAPNPYARGIYANGIVESFQTNGENINIYPEVGGTVVKVAVTEGQSVHAGDVLVQLDDSVPRATAEQQKAQADAAFALLNELKAEPRREVLAVSVTQVLAARATEKNARDQLSKLEASYRLNPKSVSKNDLDNAINAVKIAVANLEVALKQYELTKAGAWVYDIQNQESQYQSLLKQYASTVALVAKYTLKAPSDGVVLAIKTALGSYVSAQGVYGTYTEGMDPIVVMGGSEEYLQVRTYVDEILVSRLPEGEKMEGKMFIRGTNINVPLEYVRVQPYVSPKIELSDQRQERVDVRVLPVIFRFQRPKGVNIYPGQLVDVYLAEGTQRPQQLGGTSGKGGK